MPFVYKAERTSVHLETFSSYEKLVLYFQNAKNPLRTDISEWGGGHICSLAFSTSA